MAHPFPQKEVRTPSGPEMAKVRKTALNHLLRCTRDGATATGMTGGSFVILGLSIWATELAELDHAATRELLTALSDLTDPATDEAATADAEARRQAAVRQILSALDLEMSKPGGHA